MFQFYCCFHGIFDLSISLNLNLNRTLNLISCLVCKQTFKNQGDTLKKTLTDRQDGQDTEIFNAIGQEEWGSTLRQSQAQQLPRHVDPAARTGCTGRCLCYWLVVDLPLWKIWVRQLGWWSSHYMEIQKKIMFQTTNQVTFDGCYPKLSPWTS